MKARNRKTLVENAGLFKTIAVMTVCHLSVSLLCLHVMFDLVLYGVPLFLIHSLGIISNDTFYSLTSKVINWTSPIVFGFPMVFSGTKVFTNDANILLESKSQNSLLLSNHGSRIEWMVAMYVGYLNVVGDKLGKRCRVGFVCEALIQFMPLIGWYRKIIAHDIFVWRSFDKDAGTIKKNIRTFHDSAQSRMLYLSPEGVVVDHGEKDMRYIRQCQKFAMDNNMEPFQYVLTPRYKGTSCLLDQVSQGGLIVSICLAFVRDGKLLNCKLSSSERVVPDIYHLNQSIGGSPISIYIHLRKIKFDAHAHTPFDAKSVLMAEYQWKDSILAKWDARLGIKNEDKLTADFIEVRGNRIDIVLNHLAHAILWIMVGALCDCQTFFLKLWIAVYLCCSISHTIGWMVNKTSMESVPFETGIKAMMKCFSKSEERNSIKKD